RFSGRCLTVFAFIVKRRTLSRFSCRFSDSMTTCCGHGSTRKATRISGADCHPKQYNQKN
ncbi:hypothetical protein P4S72_28615, partial [Vibrio sp. PP-XX7]